MRTPQAAGDPALVVSLIMLSLAVGHQVARGQAVELLTRSGCPRCAEAKDFLAELARTEPDLVVVERQVDRDTAARERLREVSAQAGVEVPGVPTFVNVVELLCTAGLPAVYTAVLSEQGLSDGARYAYLALYNLAYIIDDAVMVTIAVVTLTKTRLTERGGRWLKLVSGVVMLALALGLVVFPEVLL